jgi:hypothetical protein
MSSFHSQNVDVDPKLLEIIRGFPTEREVEHCGELFDISPFAIYASCPRCKEKIKVRGFSGVVELEDIFDAVFRWLAKPGAVELMERRREEILADEE